MVNGPGKVILARRSVLRRRNSMSRNSTGLRRRILPATRGTMVSTPARFFTIAGVSMSMPSSAVAKRLE
jgi:hypothetical protein